MSIFVSMKFCCTFNTFWTYRMEKYTCYTLFLLKISLAFNVGDFFCKHYPSVYHW
uniref:Uncharacterized protein n=1 Tax=Arundo donax TaxID=35708 RepID=A0A0A8Y835_ARUDO